LLTSLSLNRFKNLPPDLLHGTHIKDFNPHLVRSSPVPCRPFLFPVRLESVSFTHADVLMAMLGAKPTGHVSRECTLSTVKSLSAFIQNTEEYSKFLQLIPSWIITYPAMHKTYCQSSILIYDFDSHSSLFFFEVGAGRFDGCQPLHLNLAQTPNCTVLKLELSESVDLCRLVHPPSSQCQLQRFELEINVSSRFNANISWGSFFDRKAAYFKALDVLLTHPRFSSLKHVVLRLCLKCSSNFQESVRETAIRHDHVRGCFPRLIGLEVKEEMTFEVHISMSSW